MVRESPLAEQLDSPMTGLAGVAQHSACGQGV